MKCHMLASRRRCTTILCLYEGVKMLSYARLTVVLVKITELLRVMFAILAIGRLHAAAHLPCRSTADKIMDSTVVSAFNPYDDDQGGLYLPLLPVDPSDMYAMVTPGGTDPLGRRLQVVRFSKGDIRQIRKALISLDVKILEVLDSRTLLVFGRLDAVKGVVTAYNGLMAKYEPGFKITPEASVLAEEASALSSPTRRRRNQRRSLQADSGGSPPHPDRRSGRSERAYVSSAFDAVQIWDTHSYDRPQSSFGELQNGGGEARRRRRSVQERRNDSRTAGRGNGSSSSGGGSSNTRWVNLYGISVQIVQELYPDVLRTIKQDWPGALASYLGLGDEHPCMPIFVGEALYSTTSPELQIYVCKEDYGMAVEWLSYMHITKLIEPVLNAEPVNAIAGWILQTGNLTQQQFTNPTGGLKPYWGANLWGQGTIVGVTDQGLDMSQCYFIDDKYRPGSLRSMFVGNPPRLYLPNHRKVVQYVTPETTGAICVASISNSRVRLLRLLNYDDGIGTGWFGASDQSHGTHVAGSIAGAILNSTGGIMLDAGTGVAPMARISFFGTASPRLSAPLKIPSPVDDKILSVSVVSYRRTYHVKKAKLLFRDIDSIETRMDLNG
ncbi:hypothetical protein VOLCADRAFT_95099 [Volvox carteri f. nagariensis]|uniref:Peptidase S8/S53 domain-containing protein n=1 Tax=Volvox carteri f. nagariensis TaxID=3068 RepID=D8U6L1_VOLCA|nr:uncharacterized protein VOLCADRAFT_95099 [Volvox carteri f. nagariensis]EFJ44666.1 hypothetical protein VOLCADRAFT_95099 [Volvox carteri f. nagariensis]|eukprot:XP_002954242.1 hypothetical protein VOLCADRAFT_95099 [Volvox carteri f. nagariensis]